MSRDSLRRSGVAAAIAAAILALFASSCDDPVAAALGVTAVSGPPMVNPGDPPVMSHAHRCTIPMSDIENPPAMKPYETSTDLGHHHVIQLTASALMVLAEPNGSIQVVTEPDMTGHTHVFTFQR